MNWLARVEEGQRIATCNPRRDGDSRYQEPLARFRTPAASALRSRFAVPGALQRVLGVLVVGEQFHRLVVLLRRLGEFLLRGELLSLRHVHLKLSVLLRRRRL